MHVSFDQYGFLVDGKAGELNRKYHFHDEHYLQVMDAGDNYVAMLKSGKRVVEKHLVAKRSERHLEINPGQANNVVGSLVPLHFAALDPDSIVIHDKPSEDWPLPNRPDEPTVLTDGRVIGTPTDERTCFWHGHSHTYKITGATYAVLVVDNPGALRYNGMHLGPGAEHHIDEILAHLAKLALPAPRS